MNGKLRRVNCEVECDMVENPNFTKELFNEIQMLCLSGSILQSKHVTHVTLCIPVPSCLVML